MFKLLSKFSQFLIQLSVMQIYFEGIFILEGASPQPIQVTSVSLGRISLTLGVKAKTPRLLKSCVFSLILTIPSLENVSISPEFSSNHHNMMEMMVLEPVTSRN